MSKKLLFNAISELKEEYKEIKTISSDAGLVTKDLLDSFDTNINGLEEEKNQLDTLIL